MLKSFFKKIHKFLCYKHYVRKQTQIIYEQITQNDDCFDCNI